MAGNHAREPREYIGRMQHTKRNDGCKANFFERYSPTPKKATDRNNQKNVINISIMGRKCVGVYYSVNFVFFNHNISKATVLTPTVGTYEISTFRISLFSFKPKPMTHSIELNPYIFLFSFDCHITIPILCALPR